MANINVSSWSELATALTNVSEDSTIQFTKNLDLNLEFPSGVSGILMPMTAYAVTVTGAHAPKFEANKYYQSVSSGGTETFVLLGSEPADWSSDYTQYYTKEDEDSYAPVEAENYNIRNLRNSAVVTSSIIYTNACTITLKNLDFQNLVLSGASFIGVAASADGLVVDHCRFVGSRSGEAYLFNVDHSDTLRVESCYFNIPWMGMNVPKTQLAWTSLAPKWLRTDTATCNWSATFCHFVEHYTGWEVEQSTSTDYDKAQDLVFSCECFQLNACKITGDMVLAENASSSTSSSSHKLACIIMPKSVISSYTPSMMSVFDVQLSSAGAESAGTNTYEVRLGNFFGILNQRLKTSTGKEIGANGATWYNIAGTTQVDTAKTFPKCITPTQMRNTSSLLSVGFDMIVPE